MKVNITYELYGKKIQAVAKHGDNYSIADGDTAEEAKAKVLERVKEKMKLPPAEEVEL